MGRIRPMAAVAPVWRPASGARGGLSGSQPTAEAVPPASVRPAAKAARRPAWWRSQRRLAGGWGAARLAAQEPSLSGEGAGQEEKGRGSP
jgi:hypothetical protein